jgi:aminoglycoside phosphotransferase (APT) family kinase protein
MPGGGSGALLFTARANNHTYVVRKPGDLGGPTARHLEWMKNGAELGISPKLVFADPMTGLAIMERIDGAPLTRGTPRDGDPLGALAASLRTLHRGPKLPGGLLLHSFQRFTATLEQHGRPFAADAIRAFEAANAEITITAPCHRDLNPTNLLATPDRVYLIDWETAGPADPLFDVALAGIWIARPNERLLAAYLEHEPDAAELRRHAINRVLALAFYGAAMSGIGALRNHPIYQGETSVDAIFARMATGGAMFTLPEMGSALVNEAIREARAAGLLS